MKIRVPEFALVILIGLNNNFKKHFANKHFKQNEIVSPELSRSLITDENQVTKQEFELLYMIIEKRLELKQLTVVNAANVNEKIRKEFIEIGKKNHAFILGVVFDLPTDNHFQYSLENLREEGFNFVSLLDTEDRVNFVEIQKEKLKCDLRNDCGPFDIIGDIHGCFDELYILLEKLGYNITYNRGYYNVIPPVGRKVIFLGDLVDRGPKIEEVLKIAMDMVYSGVALCVSGNHDNKLLRKLKGNNVQVKHGLEQSVDQLKGLSKDFINEVTNFLQSLESHFVLDNGNLVVAHAGMKEEYQGRLSKSVRDFALYGETTGEIDDNGLPVRYLWANDYQGKAKVLYGHTPYLEVLELNNTINIDTGCVFGNKLTAYRYPEGEFVSVNAKETYSNPSRPMK
ncbi:MAG: metallophosphoesterase [Haloplasmataceae bacterium]|jgi:protein phosphatase|nr:metallophosphoesterase [Haloplasmataceae bacterium]